MWKIDMCVKMQNFALPKRSDLGNYVASYAS